jgi:hypothetical protein
MGNNAPQFVTVNPSFFEPGLILPYAQASGAFETIATGEPLVRLGDGDQAVYAKRLDVRTRASSGQAAYNELPSVGVTMSLVRTSTYLHRVRAEWDHHDVAAYARYGVSLPETQRLGMRQGIYQFLRTALLKGVNPANGEGLLNTNGATSISLPADPYGNTTVSTYDPGAMAQWLISQLAALKSRTNQLGIPRLFVMLMPQRVGQTLEYSIVQLTSYQRIGAGSTTIAGTVKSVMQDDNGDKLIWAYDDTLIGAGSGGGNNDMILITMPEVEKPRSAKTVNTNVFATLAPGIDATTLMYVDMVAPREIPTPMPGGATDVVSELRSSSGWALRPECVTLASVLYQ